MDLSHLFSKGVKGAIVVPGSKASQTSEAFITSLKSANKFTLSRPAMQLLGITPGSQVMMIDLARVHPVELLNENNRFYIAVISREGENNIQAGAKVGKNGSFSYSIMQGAMLANDGRVEISNEDLVKMGLGVLVTAHTFVSVKDENGEVVAALSMPDAGLFNLITHYVEGDDPLLTELLLETNAIKLILCSTGIFDHKRMGK